MNEMPTFRSNWPRYSKRLAAWAESNGVKYVFHGTDRGRWHVIDFGDFYFTDINPDKLLARSKKELNIMSQHLPSEAQTQEKHA